jgi:hypothetical protein
MQHKLEYTICGVHLSDNEALLVAFVLYGLKYKQAALCMGVSYYHVKNVMHKIESSCGVHDLKHFIPKAKSSGFDEQGHYYQHTLLTEQHLRLIKRHAPDVFYDKAGG